MALTHCYTSTNREELEKFNYDLCCALKGSKDFMEDRLIVTTVEPYIDTIKHEITAYYFYVYFDSVPLPDGIKANIYGEAPYKHIDPRKMYFK